MSLTDRIAGLPGLGAARSWFIARSEREQLLLIGMAVVAVSAILVVSVWGPLASHKASALAEIARYDQLLTQAQLADKSTLKVGPAAADDGDAQSIAGSAASHGLLIRHIEPDGENTRITLENADFTHILDWVADMENAGVARVAAIQMDRRPEPGTVNAQVTLED